MLVYHGSDHVIEQPVFNGSKRSNDYGYGFYTTENINLAKYFTIICSNPEPIVDYITNELGKGATVYKAEGAYGHSEKTVILTILKRQQAVELKNYIRRNQPGAFIAITNSSEIIGKGFRGYN